MARKRGGLAGLYDRNKGLIRTGATIGATLLGGPAAGAATGAAFRGLDREGKRGIGFDVGRGALGAVEGYGVGKLTQGAQAGITKMLQPSAGGAGRAVGGAMDKIGGGIKAAGQYAAKNPDITKEAVKGVFSALPDQEDALAQEEFDLKREETERRRQQQEQMARLLMPIFQQMMQGRQGMGGGMGGMEMGGMYGQG
jgi:hypothetical protein